MPTLNGSKINLHFSMLI